VTRTAIQTKRFALQAGFFVLFVLAPVFDLLRFDLDQSHFYLFGMRWTLGLESFQRGEMDSAQAVVNLLVYGFLPLLVLAVGLIWTAWRYGRLYCGWLCPHYSVLELINNLMLRASGKPSLWEKQALPQQQADGSLLKPNRAWWLPSVIMIVAFSLLWAVVLLTYLLPPAEIYANLLNGELTRNQSIFIAVATGLLALEFTLARHFFCRYGCAVGLFQSLAWMANRRAMVVGFDRARADVCKSCNNACDNACPMRLNPRKRKRHMFTCTQCAECISACEVKQAGTSHQPLLHWARGLNAQNQSEPPVGFVSRKER